MSKGRKKASPRKPAPRRPRSPKPADSAGRPGAPVPAFPVVGIGASAGGIEATKQLLQSLPPSARVALVIVQHLQPTHESLLPEILGRATSMPVQSVESGAEIQPNRVYVLPPGKDVTIEAGRLQLKPSVRGHRVHHPIDGFFASLAAACTHRAIGVVLSGTANDGTVGMKAIKAEGGITFAQDESAEQDGMPRSAIMAGAVDAVLPPGEIAREIARIADNRLVAVEPPERLESVVSGAVLRQVLDALRTVMGADFRQYKPSTLSRRVARRMVLHRMDDPAQYVKLLATSPTEGEALFEDILIGVTQFFRNPEAFAALKTEVFPALVQGRAPQDPVRIWVLGCSTGEEAYSLAIAFTEFCEESHRRTSMQIFATDLNGAAIERARAGVFPKTIAQDVGPERLRRFFVDVDGSYRVTKSIRDACVFARHNALTDPPFSRLDLVACRNVLIYLEPALQQRLLPMMHYALRPNGYLWTGSAESVTSQRELFDAVDAKHRIYRKRPGPVHLPPTVHVPDYTTEPRERRERAHPVGDAGVVAADVLKEADRILVSRYAPPGVLVNADFEILQFRGDTGLYLTPAPGKASLNVLKMLREGLLVAVRNALHRARKEEVPVRETDLRVRSNGGYRDVAIEVMPVRVGASRELCFLVLFSQPNAQAPRGAAMPEPAPVPSSAEGADRQIARLTQELAATREYLESVIEQQEAANEELQSANDEIQSSNEELQSINEELETSKEEIQSANEELATVNDELQNRNLELGQTNNDLVNLLSSVQMAIVMLGANLRIRRLTPMAEKMLNLIPADVGRPIGDIKLSVDIPDLEQLVVEAIETMSVREREVRDKQGRWYLLRVRPYRTLENKIDGAVLVLVDVDSLKRSELLLRRQGELLDQTHEPIFMWRRDGAILFWNHGAEAVYGYSREQAVGSDPRELLGVAAAPYLEELDRVGRWSGELVHRRRDGRQITVESLMTLVQDPSGEKIVLESNRPITERKEMELTLRERAEALAQADRNKNEFLALLAHELRNPLAPITNAVQVLRSERAGADARRRGEAVLERQVRIMSRLVDDLLDVARVTQGRIVLRRRPERLRNLLEQCAEDARAQLAELGLHFTLDLPDASLVVDVDAVRLEQVVSNLLNNAAKFASRGGHVWLTAGREPSPGGDGGEVAAIRVRDDGIGMTPDDAARVFDLFMQGDRSLDRTRGGLGIGLTLVKSLVELHGGTVAVRSEGPGHGSEFIVRLPLGTASDSDGAVAEAVTVASVARRVLIVDDNADARDSMAEMLALDGHELATAGDGVEALQEARRFRPEVVLLDIGLPGVDGFEVARRLRRESATRHARIVALTGYAREDFVEEGHRAGFNDYLVKPVSAERLSALLADGAARRVAGHA